jgi:hypothetical protein
MEEIKKQLLFLLGSFLSGVAVLFAYEGVNILKGLFHFRTFSRLVMDLIFFTVSGICVFTMIFLCNDGILRSFFTLAFVAGALVYRRIFGTRVSEGCVWVLRKVFAWISRPFVWLWRKK